MAKTQCVYGNMCKNPSCWIEVKHWKLATIILFLWSRPFYGYDFTFCTRLHHIHTHELHKFHNGRITSSKPGNMIQRFGNRNRECKLHTIINMTRYKSIAHYIKIPNGYPYTYARHFQFQFASFCLDVMLSSMSISLVW